MRQLFCAACGGATVMVTIGDDSGTTSATARIR